MNHINAFVEGDIAMLDSKSNIKTMKKTQVFTPKQWFLDSKK